MQRNHAKAAAARSFSTKLAQSGPAALYARNNAIDIRRRGIKSRGYSDRDEVELDTPLLTQSRHRCFRSALAPGGACTLAAPV
jgi:hypothetical protein